MKNKIKVALFIVLTVSCIFATVIVLRNFDGKIQMPIFKKDIVINIDATDDVVKMIDNLDYNKETIDQARSFYDSLSRDQKNKVYNYQKLVEYEEKRFEIDAVESLIYSIDGSQESIFAAKDSYDNLDSSLQSFVSNYDKLVDAQQKYIYNDPDDPTPVDPVDPVDPTPVDPVDPTPVDPVDPTPVDPVDPTPVDPVDPTPVDPKPTDPVDTKTIKKGDTVTFIGGKVYKSSYSTEATVTRNYTIKCTVTMIQKGSLHPYHLVSKENPSIVYGWCDAKSIKR